MMRHNYNHEYEIPCFTEQFAAVIAGAGLPLLIMEDYDSIAPPSFFTQNPLKPEVIEKIKSIPGYERFHEVR